MPVRREYVSSLYRDLLGREGSDQEIEGHLNNPGGEEGLRQFFLGSPEYTRAHGGQASWEDVGGQVVQKPPSSTPAPSGGDTSNTMPVPGSPPPSAAVGSLSSFTNPSGYDFSAFNTGRVQDPNKSAKDAFAMASAVAPPTPFHSKAELPQWFNQYVRPQFEALGHKVLSVDEDGFVYTNHEGTFRVDYAQNAGAAPGSMQQRLQWNATPADDATRARYPAGGATTNTLNGIANLNKQLGLGAQFGGPGSPGVMNGPVQQVGQDPLSQLITGGLAQLIGDNGMTADGQGVMGALRAIIDSGGYLPQGSDARLRKFESARELMAKGERTAMTDARAALADRGLLSEPGNVSGAEMSTIGRVQTRNAEEFARALRDIGIAEDDAANSRLTAALGLATGMATDQARTLLATLGAGTDRQNMLSQVALESLQTNMAWNQFLAQFGLDRDKAMYQIQSGNIDQLMPYLALFMQMAQLTSRGYV